MNAAANYLESRKMFIEIFKNIENDAKKFKSENCDVNIKCQLKIFQKQNVFCILLDSVNVRNIRFRQMHFPEKLPSVTSLSYSPNVRR